MTNNQLTRFLLIERSKAEAGAKEFDKSFKLRRNSVESIVRNSWAGEARAYDRVLAFLQECDSDAA
jgi:hypothetical protein